VCAIVSGVSRHGRIEIAAIPIGWLLGQDAGERMNTKSGTFDEKLRALETLYAWHDEVADSFGPWACARGCSTCCTSLVTLTTLEAAYLWDRYSEPVRERLSKRKWKFSLPPLGMTVNERAALCGAREDFEDDAPPEDISVCPLLDDGRCMCYEARPLMCRMMLSSIRTAGRATWSICCRYSARRISWRRIGSE